MGAIQPEGGESAHVQDSTKLKCPYCDGTEIMLSDLMDDPNDITGDTDFAGLFMSNTGGGGIQGLVGLCVQCGHEWVPIWYLFDIATGAAGTAVTFTNLVTDDSENATLSLLNGCYAVYLDAVGTDTGLYYVITTNTAADPAVLTMTIATNSNEVGIWMITNILPVGRDPAI